MSLILPESAKADVKRWVLLAVSALAVSGIAPLILLLGRGSSLADKEVIKATFHDALVVHVDLSVVAWFLAIQLLFWAISNGTDERLPLIRKAAQWCFGLGSACIALSPLLRDGVPLMSNYIPVYTSALFFFGLGLLGASLILGLIDSLRADFSDPIRFGIQGSALIILLALVHFAWAYVRLPIPPEASKDYYEMVFWAGGHILQLAYTQALVVAWIWLARESGLRFALSNKLLYILLAIYPVIAIVSPIAFLNGSIPYDMGFFTTQMREGGGITAALVSLYLLFLLLKSGTALKEEKQLRVCLWVSLIVFAVGGIIAHLISGINTIIPAHYHGSIVGTTLAFMAVIYMLLPKLGFADIRARKLAFWQPFLYGGGSLMHAVGFAIAGHYGVERKTVGTVENLPTLAKTALQMMRWGGGLALIGGACFVALVIIAIRTKRKSA